MCLDVAEMLDYAKGRNSRESIVNRRELMSAALAVGGAAVLAPNAMAKTAPIDTSKKAGVALGGVDVVAYFTEKTSKPGKPEFKTHWKDVDWYFSSAENMQAFIAAPEKFAPQYGGYCAYAAAKGGVAAGDPQVWSVVDGKLYINLSDAVKKLWVQDIPGNIAKANKNWPGLSQ